VLNIIWKSKRNKNDESVSSSDNLTNQLLYLCLFAYFFAFFTYKNFIKSKALNEIKNAKKRLNDRLGHDDRAFLNQRFHSLIIEPEENESDSFFFTFLKNIVKYFGGVVNQILNFFKQNSTKTQTSGDGSQDINVTESIINQLFNTIKQDDDLYMALLYLSILITIYDIVENIIQELNENVPLIKNTMIFLELTCSSGLLIRLCLMILCLLILCILGFLDKF